MKLTELFNSKTVFSLEVFPPRNELSSQRIIPTLEGLQEIAPDFISVTLGAGGIGHDQGTFEIADFIQNTLNIPAVVHVPCLYLSQEQYLHYLIS